MWARGGLGAVTRDAAELRRALRAARRAIDPDAQAEAAIAAAALLEAALAAQPPATVSAYLATDGELSPAPIVARLRALGSSVAYPRIVDGAMRFQLVDDEAALVPGRWGLMDPPADAPAVAPTELDLVLTPLVGFDESLNRLGRGRAYYDVAFGFLRTRPRPARPRLVGLAHEVQRVDALDADPHDVRLDAVVTPARVRGDLTAR